MLMYFERLFLSDFMPHGYCMRWQPDVVWLHVGSDALIVLAYLSIPFLLFRVTRKRHDIPFDWMFMAFGAFILACGATHAMSIVTLWKPLYWLEGFFKAVTALASVTTALCLWRLMPALVRIPNRGELETANESLGEIRNKANLLREREEQVESAFQAARVGTWKWDFATGEISWGPQMKRLYGLAPDADVKHIDQFFTKMLHPDDKDAVSSALQTCIERRAALNTEFRIFHPDGSIHWLGARGAVLTGPSGEPTGMLGMNMDVTARRQAEDALRESEQQFATLADAIPQLAWMANPDGHLFWYNRRWYEYTNTTPVQMEGWGWQSVHDPVELPAVLARWRACIASGAPFEMEFPLLGGDGQFRWFLTLVTPVLDCNGKVVRWFGTNTDVTESRQARESLRQSERELRLLANAMPHMAWTATPDGVGDFYNQRCCDYLGLTLEQIRERDWLDSLHPDDRKRCQERMALAFDRAQEYELEYRLARASDGQYRWHLGRGVPIFNSEGEVLRWVGTCTDIDDYKTAQDRILRFNEELEERVRRRTTELQSANRELQIFSRKLEHSNGELQDFASVASHDLQEPLRKVQVFGDRLKQGYASALDQQGLDYLDRMLKAAKRMQALIQDLLSFSRITSQAHPLLPVDLNRVAAEVLCDLEVQIAETHGVVDVGELPVLDADRGQMRQLLQNLIGNGLKFRKKDERPMLRIYAEPCGTGESGNGYCRLFVADRGIGFNEKYLDRIFTVFQRLHGRAEYEGTGVGLAICRKIAQRHGGEITAKSAPGKGATFIVKLPLCGDFARLPQIIDGAADKNHEAVLSTL